MNNVLASALFACAISIAPLASADEIAIPFGGITLLGNYEQGNRENPKTVALITHGTLAYGGHETIKGIQTALNERGLASIAHNLSFGIDRRDGMYNCSVDHIHREEDARLEIKAWVDHLKEERGVEDVILVGHSRGGRQVLQAASGGADVSGLVLVAPLTKAAEQASRDRFAELYGAEWGPMVEEARELRPNSSMQTPGFLFCPEATARASSVLSYYGEDPIGAEDLAAASNLRTLVVVAEEDEVVTDVEEAFEPLDDGERLYVAMVEGSEHFFLDFFADDVADLIVEFLNEDEQEQDFGIDWDAADLAYGEYLGAECTACHTSSGASNIPGIAGLPANYFYGALRAYGSGTRDNSAMKSVVDSLDTEQMIALSAYFETVEAE